MDFDIRRSFELLGDIGSQDWTDDDSDGLFTMVCHYISKYVYRLYGMSYINRWMREHQGSSFVDLFTASDVAYTNMVIYGNSRVWEQAIEIKNMDVEEQEKYKPKNRKKLPAVAKRKKALARKKRRKRRKAPKLKRKRALPLKRKSTKKKNLAKTTAKKKRKSSSAKTTKPKRRKTTRRSQKTSKPTKASTQTAWRKLATRNTPKKQSTNASATTSSKLSSISNTSLSR